MLIVDMRAESAYGKPMVRNHTLPVLRCARQISGLVRAVQS